uniref:TIL domain-containing protein n=1 Tax=Glossina austeni TaxID=7395 RepID=A0A1A9VD20_GLOAU
MFNKLLKIFLILSVIICILDHSVEAQRRGRRCGPNEQFTRCGSACEPACNQPANIGCLAVCIENVCQCRRGFLRNSAGRCVPPRACYR